MFKFISFHSNLPSNNVAVTSSRGQDQSRASLAVGKLDVGAELEQE